MSNEIDILPNKTGYELRKIALLLFLRGVVVMRPAGVRAVAGSRPLTATLGQERHLVRHSFLIEALAGIVVYALKKRS